MNIVMVSFWDFQETGMQVTLRTPIHFAQRGHRVHFLVHSEMTAHPSTRVDVHPNVSVTRFRLPMQWCAKVPKVRRVRQLLLFYWLSRQYMNNMYASGERPDILYAAECDGVLVASALRSRARVPLVTRYYGLSEELLEHPIRHLLYSAAVRVPADLIIVTDDGTHGLQHMRRFQKQDANIMFWRNGVDMPQVNDLRVAAIRKACQLLPRERVMMTVGRLYDWKRVGVAIRAVAELSKPPRRRVKLLVVGTGPEESRLRQLAADLRVTDRVLFVGAVEHTDIYNFYAVADMVLSMHTMANLGNQAWETLNAGKLFITLACGGSTEVFRNGDNAVLVDDCDDDRTLAVRIAGALGPIADDARTYESMCLRSASTAKSVLWSWEDRLDAELAAITRLVPRSVGAQSYQRPNSECE